MLNIFIGYSSFVLISFKFNNLIKSLHNIFLKDLVSPYCLINFIYNAFGLFLGSSFMSLHIFSNPHIFSL